MKTITYTYKSKGLAVCLGLFLGGLGLHRFYLGDTGLGILYVLTFAVAIVAPPMAIFVGLTALIDSIAIACRDREYFKRESGYSEVSNG